MGVVFCLNIGTAIPDLLLCEVISVAVQQADSWCISHYAVLENRNGWCGWVWSLCNACPVKSWGSTAEFHKVCVTAVVLPKLLDQCGCCIEGLLVAMHNWYQDAVAWFGDHVPMVVYVLGSFGDQMELVLHVFNGRPVWRMHMEWSFSGYIQWHLAASLQACVCDLQVAPSHMSIILERKRDVSNEPCTCVRKLLVELTIYM